MRHEAISNDLERGRIADPPPLELATTDWKDGWKAHDVDDVIISGGGGGDRERAYHNT